MNRVKWFCTVIITVRPVFGRKLRILPSICIILPTDTSANRQLPAHEDRSVKWLRSKFANWTVYGGLKRRTSTTTPPPSMHNRDGQVPVGVSDWDKQRQVDYITRQLHLVLHCQSVHRSGLCHSSQLSKPPYWTEDCRYSKPHAKGLSLVWLPLTTTYSIISYREYHFNLRLFDLQPPFQEHNKGLNKGNLYTVQVNRNNLFTLWTALDIFREPGYRSLAPRYKPQGPGIEFRHEEERFLVSKTLETCSGVQPDSYSIGRLQLKCDDTGWRTGGEVKGKLANGVGSQYSSHYLGTWCIQHYYRWCANLGCQ